MNNSEKFNLVKKINLPIGHYAITSSGPMGIRGLREIGDIDIVVDEKLWQELVQKHPITNEPIEKITIHPLIDVFHEASFGARNQDAPSVSDQISEAEIIDGLSFVNLEHVLYFKKTMGRDKDTADVQLIEEYLRKHARD